MSRRHHREPVSLGDSLHDVVRSLRPPADATPGGASGGASATALGGLFGRWLDAVGETVAAHVQPVKLDGTRLVVEVDDPAWATQVPFFEPTIRARLAEVAGLRVERVEVRVKRPSRER